jgi:1-acyl-sn-glycerol-3-phosphate acyltransferase
MFLAKLIFIKILGWKIKGNFSDNVKKTVVVVVPHTSWHDFYIGVFTRKILGFPISYVGKKELFDSPLGWYFKWMGGEPIDRSSTMNKVEQIVNIFNSKDEFRLAIAPEGTRKKVAQWKTGYYYIAHSAKVPLTLVSFDYSTKTVSISEPLYTTGDYDKDFKRIKLFFKGVVGKVPEYT